MRLDDKDISGLFRYDIVCSEGSFKSSIPVTKSNIFLIQKIYWNQKNDSSPRRTPNQFPPSTPERAVKQTYIIRSSSTNPCTCVCTNPPGKRESQPCGISFLGTPPAHPTSHPSCVVRIAPEKLPPRIEDRNDSSSRDDAPQKKKKKKESQSRVAKQNRGPATTTTGL